MFPSSKLNSDAVQEMFESEEKLSSARSMPGFFLLPYTVLYVIPMGHVLSKIPYVLISYHSLPEQHAVYIPLHSDLLQNSLLFQVFKLKQLKNQTIFFNDHKDTT